MYVTLTNRLYETIIEKLLQRVDSRPKAWVHLCEQLTRLTRKLFRYGRLEEKVSVM